MFQKILIAISFILFPLQLLAAQFERDASYQVCFTPPENCTQLIVNAINDGVRTIDVQAYSFTSKPIGQALVVAAQRGVKVNVILDKSVLNYPRNVADFFVKNKIPVWIDRKPAIAHNKVMIIDKTTVVTGSFNFTRAAQQRNAENVLIIDDAKLADKYEQNWQTRERVSNVYTNKQNAEQPYDWVQAFMDWLAKLWKEIFR